MSVKDLILKPISRAEADSCIKKWHYSGKSYPKSQIHMGVFWHGDLRGALAWGDPLDRRKVLPLVSDTPWEGMCELNRMALHPDLPRNAESRAISVALRMIRRHAPKIQWVISFADGTQCGDGAIYRASGWWLTSIKRNTSLWRDLDGVVFSDVGLRSSIAMRARYARIASAVLRRPVLSSEVTTSLLRTVGMTPLVGYQLRYLYPLHPGVRERLAVPILPYSDIDAAGARMYKGQALAHREASVPAEERRCDPDPNAFDMELDHG